MFIIIFFPDRPTDPPSQEVGDGKRNILLGWLNGKDKKNFSYRLKKRCQNNFLPLGKFLLTENSNGKARLLIPLELVLDSHNSNHGSMCIRFNYFMKGGSLSLYEIENKQGSQETQITSVSGGQGSWMCKKVTVQVSVHRQLRFDANASGGPIALDDISFTDGACS